MEKNKDNQTKEFSVAGLGCRVFLSGHVSQLLEKKNKKKQLCFANKANANILDGPVWLLQTGQDWLICHVGDS